MNMAKSGTANMLILMLLAFGGSAAKLKAKEDCQTLAHGIRPPNIGDRSPSYIGEVDT